jgi:type I restriction enzyme S subunit
MSGWTNAALADVIEESRPGFACGEDPPEGVFQFRMNNITTDGRLDFSKRRRVPRDQRNVEAYLLQPGDVLFNATNSPDLVGKSAYFPGYDEPAVFSNHFLRLRPRPDVLDGRYLAYWLRLQFQRGVFQGMCRQWVNQASVNRDSLLGLELPLPPLPEQRRIAAVLDRADALRATCRAALAQLDQLTRAIFLEMFGDPIANPKGWPKRRIREIGRVVTGNTPPRSQAHLFGTAIEWIKSDNINTPQDYLTRAEEGLSEAGRLVGRIVPAGSILVTCIAGSPDCIGNAALADRDVAFNQQINALVPEQGDSTFFYFQLVVGKRLVQSASTSGMKGMVSKSRFEQIELLFPPLALQSEFARRAAAVERLKEAHRASLAELDALFASLQHRAFRGEL